MAENMTGTRLQVLTWIESHVTTWSAIADPEAVGLTEAQVAAVTAAAAAARQAYDGAQLARDNALSATQLWHDQLDAARGVASAVIASVKSYAGATANPAVYARADISRAAAPSARPAPPTPTSTTATVGADGAVTVRWKNSAASGAAYLVYRQLNGDGPFELVRTVSGAKKYRDSRVPVGTTSVLYLIVAQRNGLESQPSSPAYARLGVEGASERGSGQMVK